MEKDRVKKDLYDISRMEIANCMMQITRVQGTLPKEDLYKCYNNFYK